MGIHNPEVGGSCPPSRYRNKRYSINGLSKVRTFFYAQNLPAITFYNETEHDLSTKPNSNSIVITPVFIQNKLFWQI